MRFAILASLVLALQTRATAQTGGDMQERIAALKQSVQQSIQQSAAILKQHEWIETTTVSVKGEVKSTLMKRCYYGAEGKVQKIPKKNPHTYRSPLPSTPETVEDPFSTKRGKWWEWQRQGISSHRTWPLLSFLVLASLPGNP